LVFGTKGWEFEPLRAHPFLRAVSELLSLLARSFTFLFTFSPLPTDN
jgi:hypothetical protein